MKNVSSFYLRTTDRPSFRPPLTQDKTDRENESQTFYLPGHYTIMSEQLKHIRSGALSDPPGMSMYTLVGHSPRTGCPYYRCHRNTSDLEGYHTSLASETRGPKGKHVGLEWMVTVSEMHDWTVFLQASRRARVIDHTMLHDDYQLCDQLFAWSNRLGHTGDQNALPNHKPSKQRELNGAPVPIFCRPGSQCLTDTFLQGLEPASSRNSRLAAPSAKTGIAMPPLVPLGTLPQLPTLPQTTLRGPGGAKGPAAPSGPVLDNSPTLGKHQRTPYQSGSTHLRNALFGDGGGSATPLQCKFKLTSVLTLDDKVSLFTDKDCVDDWPTLQCSALFKRGRLLSDSCASHAVSAEIARANCRSDLTAANFFGLQNMFSKDVTPTAQQSAAYKLPLLLQPNQPLLQLSLPYVNPAPLPPAGAAAPPQSGGAQAGGSGAGSAGGAHVTTQGQTKVLDEGLRRKRHTLLKRLNRLSKATPNRRTLDVDIANAEQAHAILTRPGNEHMYEYPDLT